MTYRRISISLAACGLVAIGMAQFADGWWNMLPPLGQYFTAKNCMICAHVLVYAGLLMEAAAMWVSASDSKHRSTVKSVALMFALAGVLGFGSVSLEMVAMNA